MGGKQKEKLVAASLGETSRLTEGKIRRILSRLGLCLGREGPF